MERYIENRKIAYAPRPRKAGQTPWNKGKKCPYMTERNLKNPIKMIGESNHNWKGGVSPVNTKIRQSIQGRKWRKEVLTRDENKCIWCGSTEKLHVDHIKPFSLFPESRLDVENGRTLCYTCHIKSTHYCRECGLKIV